MEIAVIVEPEGDSPDQVAIWTIPKLIGHPDQHAQLALDAGTARRIASYLSTIEGDLEAAISDVRERFPTWQEMQVIGYKPDPAQIRFKKFGELRDTNDGFMLSRLAPGADGGHVGVP